MKHVTKGVRRPQAQINDNNSFDKSLIQLHISRNRQMLNNKTDTFLSNDRFI